jgi:hypothetical protein
VPERMLLPLFFGDVCHVPGWDADEAMRVFALLIRAGELRNLRGVFEWADDVPLVHAAPTALESDITPELVRVYAERVVAYDTPAIVHVGYFDPSSKRGHAVKLLVRVHGGRGVVCLTNTGEGALDDYAPPDAMENRGHATVVRLGLAGHDTARRLLCVAVAVRSRRSIVNAAHVAQFVAFVCAKLTGSVAPSGPSHSGYDGDSRLVVRSLGVVSSGIRAHTQLGDSCQFMSMLWTLGIEEALSVGCIVADAEVIRVDAAHLLRVLAGIDLTLKRAALPSLGESASLARLTRLRHGPVPGLPPGPRAPSVAASSSVTEYRFVPAGADFSAASSPYFATWGDAAAWVDRVGAAHWHWPTFPLSLASFAAFMQKLGSVLHTPLDLSALDALRVASFCGGFRRSVRHIPAPYRYHADVASGIMLRVATHVAGMVGGDPLEHAAALSDAVRDFAVLPVFDTSLPWAAVEYERFQAAIQAVKPLIFSADSRHTALLSSLASRSARSAVIQVGELGGEYALTGAQSAALAFLCATPEVAVLNVVLAWLAAPREGLPGRAFGNQRFLFGSKLDRIYFEVVRDGTIQSYPTWVKVLSRLPDVPAPKRQCTPSRNIECLYQSTRDIFGAPEPGAETELCLRADHGYDAPALARWFDFVYETAGYEQRAFGYAMRRALMPLSTRGVRARDLDALRARAATLFPSAPSERLACALLRGERASVEGLHGVDAACVVVLAVALRRTEELFGTSGRATTVPDSSWALTRIAAPNYTSTLVAAGSAFVFESVGGLESEVRRRLVRAGCAFDHWETPGESRIELADGTRVDFATRTVVRGTDVYALDVRASDWWDETTGAAVLPVRNESGAFLFVVPATREFEFSDVHLSAAAVLDQRTDVKAVCVELLRRPPFLVAFDRAGVMPGEVETAELACVFVAYAYAGSVCGTRLMPFVAAHAVAEKGTIGEESAVEAMRRLILNAPCPMGFYAACAVLYPIAHAPELGLQLRCAPGAEFPELRETLAGFRALYEADEWAAAHAGVAPADPCARAFEARTGKRISEKQQAKIDEIVGLTEVGGVVAQIQMGFGKSSVVVPMLVAAYLRRQGIRVVVVTQPDRLVAEAAHTIGSFVAALSLGLVYVLSERDVRATHGAIAAMLAGRATMHKLVVVLSTADMQALVRDFAPLLYGNSDRIAHIADEIDGESDPLTCEVTIRGREATAHPDRGVAASVADYYDAAFSLVAGDGEVTAKLARLNAMSGAVKVGDRLRAVHASLCAPSGPKHRVAYGMADDAADLLVVPYDYAAVPSKSKFVDAEVTAVLAAATALRGMRASDVALVARDVRAKFGEAASARVAASAALRAEYFATQLAMPRMRVSARETVVAFADALGAGRTFVGFSGTMGIGIDVPPYALGDSRRGLTLTLLSDAEATARVRARIAGAPCHPVPPAEFGVDRALGVLAVVRAAIAGRRVCVIDASGELGVFADDVAEVSRALGEDVGYFDAGGVLRNKQLGVRYYRHRDSRGVDSVMSDGAVGLVIVTYETTRASAASQAAYRMRGFDDGTHSVEFVVACDGATGPLLARLDANEAAYVAASVELRARQAAHAATPKTDARSFEREATYAPFTLGGGMRTHRAESQAIAQHISNEQLVARCYERGASGISAIALALRVLGLSMSPILQSPAPHAYELRRAFGTGDGSLAVMTVVEAWTVRGMATFTHDGRQIGAGVAGGATKLLGRYLCDDALALGEEVALVAHLSARYAARHAALRAVVVCLLDSGFLKRQTLLLAQLRHTPIGDLHARVERDIRGVIAGAIGPSVRLREALVPMSFGRSRRTYV